MLHGSAPEASFGDGEAARVIGGAKSLQFAPGTRYSYANQNFRLLSDIVQERTGRSFGELLRACVFAPAGMETALLAADTRALPDGTEGYEGTPAAGFRAAENRIIWTGDAGLGANLDDMIAWERHLDKTRDDPAALYQRLSSPVVFSDGTPAAYGFGLNRGIEFGRSVTGHGGALRGWRSHRLYVPAERVSVVVMFNHLADARDAAIDVLAAVLGVDPDPPPEPRRIPDWLGAYIGPDSALSARVDMEGGKVRLRYGHHPDLLRLQANGTATSPAIRLRPDGSGLSMDRLSENDSLFLRPCRSAPMRDIAGRYHCDELDAELTVTDAGDVLYGGFAGFLGQSRMELLSPLGDDAWLLPCARALDHTPPGDWTLLFQRDLSGRISEVTVGCWLARRLHYRRI
jgi:D-aminopeptidase